MSFTYTRGLPNPPDDPSDDVSGMQINTNTIDDWTKVDHIGFNNSSGGQHKQITFSGNFPPAVPTSPPILFTNIQDGATPPNSLPNGIAELFFYSGTAAQGQSNNVIAANGSIMLMGGIILKWLETTTSPGGTPFTFGSPTANPFPNNLFAMTIGGLAGGAQPFSIRNESVSGGFAMSTNPQRAYIIAIGN